VQITLDLANPNWEPFASAICDLDGTVRFILPAVDKDAPPAVFFRAIAAMDDPTQ
jgi:hypothetical protein